MRLWSLTRRPGLTLGAVTALGLVTGALAALAPSERLQFLPVLPAVVLAWSLRSRDDAREVWAPRSPGPHDAALLACATLLFIATTVAAIAVLAPEQLALHQFVVWSSFFSVGLLGLLTSVSRLPTAAATLVLVQLTSFFVQYLFRPHGPLIALISQTSPPALGWSVSLATWAAGVAVIATSARRRGIAVAGLSSPGR